MHNPQNIFNVIKTQTKNINSALEAITQAQEQFEILKSLAVKRASGQFIDIEKLAYVAVNTKDAISTVMINIIESQTFQPELTKGEIND